MAQSKEPELPTQTLPEKHSPLHDARSASASKKGKNGVIFVAVTIIVLFIISTLPLSPACHKKGHKKIHSCEDVDRGYTCRPEISRFWGQYSPYFSVPSEIKDELPSSCRVNFVDLLSRHGARDPTLSRTMKYSYSVSKIKSRVKKFTGKYAFLKKFEYNLRADQLSTFGEQQLVNSGIKFFNRYQHLAEHETPFIRASGQKRVVDSAVNWTQGFHDTKLRHTHRLPDSFPYDILVINEGKQFNNTLDHSRCTAFETGPFANIPADAKATWAGVYTPPILKRLNRDLPNADLDDFDIVNLMAMCPFETVHDVNGHISPFCDLFTEKEWQMYNHYENLDKYYSFGRGNPLGPTQGVGFVNELLARLTRTPVEDDTSTNKTLDSSPETFPLDRNLYADFSHDNDLTAAFFALGLYDDVPPLSNTSVDSIEHTKMWSSAYTAPFAARAYFERISCEGENEELVRILINDRVIPMPKCGSDEYGRCTLSKFVDSQTFARNGGEWSACFP